MRGVLILKSFRGKYVGREDLTLANMTISGPLAEMGVLTLVSLRDGYSRGEDLTLESLRERYAETGLLTLVSLRNMYAGGVLILESLWDEYAGREGVNCGINKEYICWRGC